MNHTNPSGHARLATPLWQMPLALLLCWLAVLVPTQWAASAKGRVQGASQLELLGGLAPADRAAVAKRHDDSSADGDKDSPPVALDAQLSWARVYLEATIALTGLDAPLLSFPVPWSPNTPRAPPA